MQLILFFFFQTNYCPGLIMIGQLKCTKTCCATRVWELRLEWDTQIMWVEYKFLNRFLFACLRQSTTGQCVYACVLPPCQHVHLEHRQPRHMVLQGVAWWQNYVNSPVYTEQWCFSPGVEALSAYSDFLEALNSFTSPQSKSGLSNELHVGKCVQNSSNTVAFPYVAFLPEQLLCRRQQIVKTCY